LIRYLAIIYVGYVLLSVLIVLPALNLITPRVVQAQLDRELRSEIILFNPFTLAVEIRKAALLAHDDSVFVSTDSALVNLSLASVWREGLVFDEVRVESLFVHIKQLASGKFNFSDMLGEPVAGSKEPSEGSLPGLTIHSLSLQSRQIRFTDEARNLPFTTHWDGLAVAVHGLSTIVEEGRPYSFDATAESGGHLHWEGEVSVPGAFSEGTLELDNLSLLPLWRYAEQWLALELKGGSLNVSGDYRLAWGDGLAYQVSNGQVALRNIDIQPRDAASLPDTAVAVRALELTCIEVDSATEMAEIGSVDISGVGVQGFSEGDEISLASMFELSFPEGEPGTGESNWQAHFPNVQLSGSELRWRSQFTSPPVLSLSPIALRLTNLNWPPAGETGLDLTLAINDSANLSVTGGVDLGNGNGRLSYQLGNLQLTMLNPNLPAELNAQISRGALGAKGELILEDFAPGRVLMEGGVTDFAGIIEDKEEALTSWDTVRWQGLDVNLTQRSIILKSLGLNGYSGRLHIYEDGTINAQQVVQAKVDEAMQDGTLKEEEIRSWSFDIPSIYFTDSELNFTDESLPIKFQTVIGELNGEISGLNSSGDRETRVDLKGSVDGYAPVVLAGKARPFSSTPIVDMGLTFDGIDLVRLTPYSGTYAGYAIDRGTLNLDLHYTLDGNRLKGDNSVVIDQLKLGDKIDSDQAVDLPLELALALLTDSNGVIDMEVPVTGDVDDPDFGLGSVIASAFVNLVTKAVTAPFTLLANLVGSEDDMQRISFSSGSSELDDAARAKLADLSSALAQRPGIKLVLYGRIHPTADREFLQKSILEEQLLAAGLSGEDLSSKSAAWARSIQARYKQLAADTDSTEGGEDVPMLRQYERVVASVAVSDEQLKSLAEERAVALKRYLVNDLRLAADRSAIESPDITDEANKFSGVELGVDI